MRGVRPPLERAAETIRYEASPRAGCIARVGASVDSTSEYIETPVFPAAQGATVEPDYFLL